MPGVPPTRYVYLGPEGTFAEQALRSIIARKRTSVSPARSVPEALEAVRSGDADAALVPLENSIGGAVGVTLDELATGSPLVITREVVLPVEFVLGARAGMTLDAVRTVAAHPQAAAQCRGWLRTHLPDAAVVEVLSNGAAAVAAAAGEYDAGICAPIGAERHRLSVLAKDISDHPEALTRFALVARPGPPPPPTGDDVTSLAVYISHDRVGALLAVLTELAVRGVNLTRIESRPTGERLGRYAFFLDCTGHVAEARMGEALQGLYRVCAEVRFLGSYPRARHPGDTGAPAPPPGTSDKDFADSAAWLARLRAGEVA
ncbi:MAG TPA: prephenate dehydratase [Micromonosporaceae bacterium]|nr:prephenate dehydratase [Micromonosporaceae bacterium]